jgi:hypothetical protein
MSRTRFAVLIGAIVLVGVVIASTLIVVDVQRRHDACLQKWSYPQSQVMCD